ncbi:glycerol-3-phosphate 1-O-acyltransferase PlsY [Anaerolineales bacterium]
MELNVLNVILIVVISYLIGSFPTAYFVAKSRRINIFAVGSGNMGGTNVARSLGFWWGILTALIDILKGVIAVLIAQWIMPDKQWTAITISSISVIIGHNWSLFASLLYAAVNHSPFSFRGGKGAATAFGTLLVIAPPLIPIIMVTIGGVIVLITRYVSLGVLVAFGLAVIGLLYMVGNNFLPPEVLVYTLVLSFLILHRFRDNIKRLVLGQERKLGERI